MSASQWICGVLCIISVRFLLENFSNPSFSGIIVSDAPTLVHYSIFYAAVALASCALLSLFLPAESKHIYKFMLFGLMATWIAPLIDLASGDRMAYIFEGSAKALGIDFLTYFGPMAERGVSIGIRIELGLILIGVFCAILILKKSVWRALGAAFSMYVLMFFSLALPSFIYLLHVAIFPQAAMLSSLYANPVTSYFSSTDAASLIGSHFLHQTLAFATPSRGMEIYFDVALSQVLYLFGIIAALFYIAQAFPGKIIALMKNSRPERLLHYFALVAAGLFAAHTSAFSGGLPLWQNYATILILFLSFYFAWMFAVGINDLEDVSIDAISNVGRPLIDGKLSQSDMRSANAFFFAASLAGGYLAGHYAFYCILVFTCAYYMYSAAPLRLKRVPIVSTFLIAIASLSAAIAGFFTINDDPRLSAFSLSWAVLILAAFTLITPIKDIKDIEGDSAEGVTTLPVILGPRIGKQVTGLLAGFSFLLAPLIFHKLFLLVISVPAAIICYLLVNRRAYREIYIFILYFIYLAAIGLAVWMGFL